jgi:transposase-like protein
MSVKVKRRNAKPKTDIAIVKAVFYDIQHTNLTLGQIASKHGVSSSSVVTRWKQKYWEDFCGMEESKLPVSKDIGLNEDVTNKVTEHALREAELKILCLETMIDIAEKEFNISIRKKPGTKQ